MIVKCVLFVVKTCPIAVISGTRRPPLPCSNLDPDRIETIFLWGSRVRAKYVFGILNVLPLATILELHFEIGWSDVNGAASETKVIVQEILIGVESRPITSISSAC
jgi:hypothetical protein